MPHAIILGSGMAGLAAAGVLAKRFERVTILERDAAPEEREPRKGVPQGRHAHIFLKAGELAFEQIFPGLTAELDARGSHRIDFGADFAWFHHGVWKRRYEGGIAIRMQSRPFLESIVRERLGRIGNVAFRYGTSAVGIEIAEGRATAVHLREDGSDQEERLAADLIVDASGRGSQLTRWLKGQGYPSPREERLPVNLQYATRVYKVPPGAGRTWKALLVYHNPPEETRIGLIFPLEGNRWVVTLGGYAGDHPPADEAGWLDFARSLAQPTLIEAIRDAEPLTGIETFRFPFARWSHFEGLRRFPHGLLPLGDTVCSFDPVFGQGMSVAAQSAVALAAHLDRDPAAARPLSFFRRQAFLVFVPWLLLSSEDLRYPQVEARRPFWMPALQRYTHQVFLLTGTSAPAYHRLLRVLHLTASPALLFHPAMMAGIVGQLLRPAPPQTAISGAAAES